MMLFSNVTNDAVFNVRCLMPCRSAEGFSCQREPRFVLPLSIQVGYFLLDDFLSRMEARLPVVGGNCAYQHRDIAVAVSWFSGKWTFADFIEVVRFKQTW